MSYTLCPYESYSTIINNKITKDLKITSSTEVNQLKDDVKEEFLVLSKDRTILNSLISLWYNLRQYDPQETRMILTEEQKRL